MSHQHQSSGQKWIRWTIPVTYLKTNNAPSVKQQFERSLHPEIGFTVWPVETLIPTFIFIIAVHSFVYLGRIMKPTFFGQLIILLIMMSLRDQLECPLNHNDASQVTNAVRMHKMINPSFDFNFHCGLLILFQTTWHQSTSWWWWRLCSMGR